MHVISKAVWRDAIRKDRTLEDPLSAWQKVATSADWGSLVDVRKVHPSSDFVDPYTVFNMKGGAYRLIVKIEYRWQMIFVKHVLTHVEYDRGEWKK